MLGVQSADLRAVDASPRRLREMAQGWSQRPNFVPIRLNELFNGLQVEHTDDYVLAMVGGLGGRHEQEVRLFMLRHDHALRDQVFWRVFEVEGGGEISLANIDKFSREEFNWHNTVVLLANEGTLERAARCAAAWRRSTGISPPIAPAGSRACMRPWRPRPKKRRRTSRCCACAWVRRSPPLSRWASSSWRSCTSTACSTPRPSCKLAAALSGPKAAALSVLRMLEALGARAAVESDAVAQALALGLGHPHADVQRAAVKALARLGREDLAHQQRDALAPAVAAMLSDAGAGSAAGRAGGGRPSPPSSNALPGLPPPAPLRPGPTRMPRNAMPRCWKRPPTRWSSSWRWPGWRRPGRWRPRSRPWRSGRATLPSATNNTTRLRCCWRRTIRERVPAAKFWQNTRSRQVDGEWVREWANKALPSAEETTMLPSFVTRLREVAGIVQGRASRRPLLATPTDTQGWVDADVLLARYEAGKESGAPFPVDLTQALLRAARTTRAWSRPPAARGRGSPTPCGSSGTAVGRKP